MSKTATNPSVEPQDLQSAAGPTNRPAVEPASGAAPAAVRVDDSNARSFYTNFCRVTGTPEELILDFALNAHPFGAASEPLVINQRLVMNYFTAKRLLQAL